MLIEKYDPTDAPDWPEIRFQAHEKGVIADSKIAGLPYCLAWAWDAWKAHSQECIRKTKLSFEQWTA